MGYVEKCLSGELSPIEERYVALVGILSIWAAFAAAFTLAILLDSKVLNWEFAVQLGSGMGAVVILWPTLILGFRHRSTWLMVVAGMASFGFIFIVESVLLGGTV